MIVLLGNNEHWLGCYVGAKWYVKAIAMNALLELVIGENDIL